MAEVITTRHDVRPIYYGSNIVWYMLGVIEVLLGFRFLFRLIGANPAASFTDFIYDTSRPLVQPFANIVGVTPIETGSGTTIFDWNTMIAMAVYWLLAYALVRLFFVSRPVSEEEADYEVRREV